MLLFVDNDVVIKLAEYGLLMSLHEIVTEAGHEIHVLNSLPYVVGVNNPSAANQVLSSQSSVEQVKKFLEVVNPASIKQATTFHIINSINDPNLDEGELTLIGCAIESDNPVLCSGDKRAIKALNNLIAAESLSFSHCIIILLEHTLQILVNSMDEDYVLKQVMRKPDVDKAIRLCFQNATSEDIDSVISGLESYINSLKMECSNLTFVELNEFFSLSSKSAWKD